MKLIEPGMKTAVMEVSSGQVILNLFPKWQLVQNASACLFNGAHKYSGYVFVTIHGPA